MVLTVGTQAPVTRDRKVRATRKLADYLYHHMKELQPEPVLRLLLRLQERGEHRNYFH